MGENFLLEKVFSKSWKDVEQKFHIVFKRKN